MGKTDIIIQPEVLRARLGVAGLCILDCRFSLSDPDAGRLAWLDGHIPGAVYADLDRDLAAPPDSHTGRHPLPSPSTAQERFRKIGVHRRSDVVVYDDAGGAFAARAWWMLRWLGHSRVRLLDGGIEAWRAAAYPLEQGANDASPGDFTASPRPGLIVTTDEVERKGASQLFLCDARDEERFAGRAEPIDPVAGHIPGARNTPFSKALDENGRFLDAEQLVPLWVEFLDGDLSRPWAAMCGSGVTACHLAVSAQLAGAAEPRLYAGSWSEWIRDPGRPVVAASKGPEGH